MRYRIIDAGNTRAIIGYSHVDHGVCSYNQAEYEFDEYLCYGDIMFILNLSREFVKQASPAFVKRCSVQLEAQKNSWHFIEKEELDAHIHAFFSDTVKSVISL